MMTSTTHPDGVLVSFRCHSDSPQSDKERVPCYLSYSESERSEGEQEGQGFFHYASSGSTYDECVTQHQYGLLVTRIFREVGVLPWCSCKRIERETSLCNIKISLCLKVQSFV